MRRLVWLIAAIAIATPCWAQSAPDIGMTTSTSQLNEQQRQSLKAFAESSVRALTGNDFDQAGRARDQLIQPLTRGGTTAVFRDEYSRIIVPLLEPVIDQPNHFASVNAMRILSQLGTIEALRAAMRHVGENTEPRAAIRVWAAKSFDLMAGTLATNRVVAAQVDAFTRDLSRAAKDETDWLVLMRQLQALGGLNTTVARKEELDVLKAITERMAAGDGPSELVHAMFPAVVGLRDRMIAVGVAPADLAKQGKDLAPVLADLLEVARDHWDKAQQDADARATYGSLVSITETTIKRIDTIVAPPTQRAPQTALKESWERQDKPKFVADVKQWSDRVASNVYR